MPGSLRHPNAKWPVVSLDFCTTASILIIQIHFIYTIPFYLTNHIFQNLERVQNAKCLGRKRDEL